VFAGSASGSVLAIPTKSQSTVNQTFYDSLLARESLLNENQVDTKTEGKTASKAQNFRAKNFLGERSMSLVSLEPKTSDYCFFYAPYFSRKIFFLSFKTVCRFKPLWS